VTKGRVEAFSDGVLAIVITIMVLELRPPEGETLDALAPLWPKLVAYALSFVYLGIYWVNHHHLMQAVRAISGSVLWANLHLLFWLSLVPAGTAWIGDTHFAALPMAIYGYMLLMPAVAFTILVATLVRVPGNEHLRTALGSDFKGKFSLVSYSVSIPIALIAPVVAFAIYVVVAAVWFVPDRRFEARAETRPDTLAR
jgi:uncharacterized membrane protein